jgi:hypothetical protein
MEAPQDAAASAGVWTTTPEVLDPEVHHSALVQQGPTEGKLGCNPVGCWREVGMAVFPFRTGTCARKWSGRGPLCFRLAVRTSGSGN